MAPKIQHKRSSSVNNPPAAGALDAGEITNADSANIHFEDASSNVRSVGADPTAGKYQRVVANNGDVGTWEPAGTPTDTGSYGYWDRTGTT